MISRYSIKMNLLTLFFHLNIFTKISLFIKMSRPKNKIVTLGCSKNTVDSEKLIKQLELNGSKVVYDETDDLPCEVVIINTCGFINDAKEESIDTILEFVKKKEEGKIKKYM